MTPEELLAQSLAKLQTANRVDGNKNSYRKDNPNEYAQVIAYLGGGARPNATSDMGMGLMLAEDARRALDVVVPPDPPDPPDPPTSAYDWLGNTFPGQNYNHVTHGAQDLAASSDGKVAICLNWSESGHEVRVHDSQAAYGPRSAIHDGSGGRACTITTSAVFVQWGQSIKRWPRSTFMQGDFQSAVRNIGVTAEGLTVVGSTLYAADLSRIHAIPENLSSGPTSSFPASGARKLTTDRQGNIWALRGDRVTRYSITGTQLSDFQVAGMILDIAAHPVDDEVWCVDNSRDQNIKRYSYSGQLMGSFGQQYGYLAGPTPGLLGPGRFCGPRGIGFDGSGNVYVAMTGIPGTSTQVAWGEMGRFLIIQALKPDGTLLWQQEGLMFCDVGSPSPDGSAFYNRELSYSRQSDGRYKVKGFTVDPWSNPNDRRIIKANVNTSESEFVREFGGKRFIAIQGASNGLAIYRLNGEVAVPAAFLSGSASDDYIQVEGMPRENRSGNLPGNVQGRDFWMEANGDVWRLDEGFGLFHYRVQGLTAQGNPIYNYANVTHIPRPPQFANIRQIEVHGQNVYVSGYDVSPDPNEFDQWKWIGKRMVKYPSLPTTAGWPIPTWNVAINYEAGPKTNAPADRGAGWAADVVSKTIAVGYQCEPGANSPYLRIYSTDTGQEMRQVRNADFPAAYGERGWLDMFRCVMSVGGMIWMEENQLSKQVGIKA